jgi:hypothetical protein
MPRLHPDRKSVRTTLCAAAILALAVCTPTIAPDHPAPSSPSGTVAPLFTMSWPQPRQYSEDWSLPLTSEAHSRACPHDGDSFRVKHFEQSPVESPTQVLITFRCDDGTFAPVKIFLQPREAAASGSESN